MGRNIKQRIKELEELELESEVCGAQRSGQIVATLKKKTQQKETGRRSTFVGDGRYSRQTQFEIL